MRPAEILLKKSSRIAKVYSILVMPVYFVNLHPEFH